MKKMRIFLLLTLVGVMFLGTANAIINVTREVSPMPTPLAATFKINDGSYSETKIFLTEGLTKSFTAPGTGYLFTVTVEGVSQSVNMATIGGPGSTYGLPDYNFPTYVYKVSITNLGNNSYSFVVGKIPKI